MGVTWRVDGLMVAVGAVALAVVALYLKRKSIAAAAGAVVDAVNPASDKNLAYRAAQPAVTRLLDILQPGPDLSDNFPDAEISRMKEWRFVDPRTGAQFMAPNPFIGQTWGVIKGVRVVRVRAPDGVMVDVANPFRRGGAYVP